MIEAEHVKTLEDFGLSYLQAKIYLVLINLGKADVKTIARESNVARQEIYRIMPALQKLGLGEKILGKPITYKATLLSKGLSILAQQQKEKYDGLLDKKRWLLDNFHVTNEKSAISEEDTQFSIISEPTLFINMNQRLLQKAEHSIDTALPLICFPSKLTQIWYQKIWSQLEKNIPSKKNLKVRIITQKNESKTKIRRFVTNCPLVEFRYLTEPVRFGIHIFDNREMTMALSETSGLPSLWSNNPNLVNMAQNHFKLLWEGAIKSL
jgi:sugar-specific transcriptional regulator TrmB